MEANVLLLCRREDGGIFLSGQWYMRERRILMSILETRNLIDYRQTIAAPLLERVRFPWEVLPQIGEFLLQLGPSLPPEEYEQVGDGIWIARSARIASTACLCGPLIAVSYTHLDVYKRQEVFRMPCFSLLGGRFPVIKKNGAYRKLEKQLKTIPCDFVIVNTRYYLHSLFGVKFAKKRGVPCITIEHGTSHLSIESPLFDRLGQWFEHFLTSRIRKYCHHFYGVSQNCCRWLTHFGIKPEGTVYNAIDLDQIQSYPVSYTHLPAFR